MMTSQDSNTEAQGTLSEIKRKLVWRMGFAGLMIVALLGGLALFDRISSPSNTEASSPQFTEPVPVPKKVLTQPVTPAEPMSESAKDGNKSTVPESSSVPVDKSTPVFEAPPRPVVAAQPGLPRASLPAGRSMSLANQPTVAVPTKPAEPKAAVVTVIPERMEQSVVARQPQSQSALPRLFSGYALQAGVFSDPRRAEELHAKLTLEGIPSTIEARVHVGPFKSREEAEVTRKKLKAMGMDAVLLMPKGVKH